MIGNVRYDIRSLHGPIGISSTLCIVNTTDRATGGMRHQIAHLQVSKFLVGQGLDRAGVDYPLLVSEALGDGVLSVYCLSGKDTRFRGVSTCPHRVSKQCCEHLHKHVTANRPEAMRTAHQRTDHQGQVIKNSRKETKRSMAAQSYLVVKVLVASPCSTLASISFALVLQGRVWNPIDVHFIT